MEEDNGLTFMDILKVIFKRIWWVLGATAACLLIVVIVTQLWYNKREQYFSVNYEIVYPDSASGKYPDGSDLLASDAISLSTLTSIKDGAYSSAENAEEFKNIDVEKMLSDDGISIAEEVTQTAGGGIKRTYALTVSSKYFSGDAQAVAFIRAVASYQVRRVNSIIDTKEYGLYFSVYEDANSYEAKIEALLSQKNYLESEYTKLKNYGSTVEVNLASLHNIFTTEQRQALADRITANYYVYDTEGYKANADTRKDALTKQIADNAKIIEAEEAKRGDSNPNDVNTNPYDQIIADYTRRNAELNNEIKTIENTTGAIESYTQEGTDEYKAKQAFDAQLEKYRTDLSTATDALKSVSKTIYADNSRVIFANNKISRQGGIGTIVSALLGAVVGLLVSAVVVCIIDLPKYKKRKLANAEVANTETAEAEVNSEPEAVETAEKTETEATEDKSKND
ncbi:MAG: hypothetical protein K2H78_00030 [Clostridia bacterium]|nr:hypothetical protein [Clostridia bacterium]